MAKGANHSIVMVLVVIYTSLWVGGLVSTFANAMPRDVEPYAGAAFLVLAAFIVLLRKRLFEAIALLIAGGIGFLSELTGVHFGMPYGAYEYTEKLGPRVLGVPVAMIAAWLVLVAYVKDVLRPFKLKHSVEVVLGAALMTMIDLVIDPLAAGPLDYWRWEEGGPYADIPLSNFLGWYVVSVVVFVICRDRWPNSPMSRNIGASIVAFFGALAFYYNLWIPGAIAVAWLVGDGLLRLREKRTVGA